MSFYQGKKITVGIYGESHSEEIGAIITGIPKGIRTDFDRLYKDLARRSPKGKVGATERIEEDKPEFRSGIKKYITTGELIDIAFANKDIKPDDYNELKNVPRPGHCDLAAYMKYGYNIPGGGQFSGRMTAPLCVAGWLAKEVLKQEGTYFLSRILSVGDITDDMPLSDDILNRSFPTMSEQRGEEIKELILKTKEEGDSIGAVVQCMVINPPARLGGALFDGMEGKIANLVFSIPAVKGVDFGLGFDFSNAYGSEVNDSYRYIDGNFTIESNYCGGVLGGITIGSPINFMVAVKPVPSISLPQETVDLEKKRNKTITIAGRHDTCLAERILPCIEAAAAIAICDEYLADLDDEDA